MSEPAPTTPPLRIVVCGYLVRGPLGGMVWFNLQYLQGLARLGHDVVFLEDSDDYPSCYDPRSDETTTDPSYGLSFAARTLGAVGFGGRWAYHDAHSGRWHGPLGEGAIERCAGADLVLNVSGINPLRPWLTPIPVRALLDSDPGFTQARHLLDPARAELARGHTHFFTFATNVGRASCRLPDDGLPWQPTRQPVVLSATRRRRAAPGGRYTTVMNWESYPRLELDGRSLGLKADSFQPYLDLPAELGEVELELALGGPAPREQLAARGWHLRDPRPVTRDVPAYERYLSGSKAEFSVAKHGYVTTGSGWFSERSTAYLASGRPVVVQDTGFSDWLPVGEGLLAFASPDEAVAAIRDVERRYELHCRAARGVVSEHFDSDRVLGELVEACVA